MTFTSRAGWMAGRWRATLAAAACAIAVAGSLAAGLPASAAARSPWSVQAVPPVDTSAPNAEFRDVSCGGATSCVAVGEYVGTDGFQRTFSEVWNGTAWRIVNPVSPAGVQASELDAVSCTSPGSCQAVGWTRTGATGPRSLIAESWTGTRWRTDPIQQPGGASLDSVSCAAPGSCLAVGERTTTNGTEQAIAQRWNGHRWSAVIPRRPLAFSQLSGVSCPRARDCYAVGWASVGRVAAGRPVVEHWTGRWTLLTAFRPARRAVLTSVSCPTASSCTAVGTSGVDSTRMLVEDLARGKWTESLPAAPSQVPAGTAGMYRVSCSAPRVCTALLSYGGEELTWAIAARGRMGGFKVTVPTGDVSMDNANGVSCRAAGCTIVGALNDNDGRGDAFSSGTPFAWRGTGGLFTPQVTPNPVGTAGGVLASVSCTTSGFCAAATSTGGNYDFVTVGDPSVLVRHSARGPWTAPPNSGSGFLSSVSCTSARFCLAMGSPAGAEQWDGQEWSELSAPDPFDPVSGGLGAVSCVTPSSCLAVGSTKTRLGFKSTALAASWNGTSWTTLTPARPAGSARSVLAGVSCVSATSCVAAGYYLATHGGALRALVETWNGSSWTIGSPDMRVPVTFPEQISVSCASATACMVTWGQFGPSLSRWWNGTRWTAPAFAGPAKRSDVRDIDSVSCTSRTSCTAAGSFIYGEISGPLVENWNGTQWSVTPAPNPVGGIGGFNAVSCTSATACTAVGGDVRVETVPFAEVRG